MEKYGVKTEEEKTAEARSERKCPVCNRELKETGNVIRCPEHGTKPFESRVRSDHDGD